MKTGSIVYSFLLALWTGGMFIFTFLVTPVIFQSFGRDAAGEIVGKLFPYYFPYNLLLSVLALIIFLLFLGMRGKIQNKIIVILLTAAVVINIFVTFKLHPDITIVKQQISTFETQTDESPARDQFRKMHGLSAILNILLLLDGTALLILNTASKK
jgi:uncharacterized membrane protein